ncbi:MAG: hypothetical protein ABIR15_23510 [Chitinophagaceae bacterium]
MKFPLIPGFLLLAGFFLSVSPITAQSTADDSIFYKKAVYNTIGLYHKAAGEQSGLYNGSQYGRFPFSFAGGGYPFFTEDKPGIGWVLYDGVLYENVELQFDEVQEVLIMQDTIRRMQLLNPKIAAFALFNNSFIRIVKDSTTAPLIRTGFYNQLYKGNINLLKREEKIIREEVSTGELLRYIDVETFYYIQKNNTFYNIKNKSSILDIFKDRKKEVRQYIRKNKLSYKQDRDGMLVKVTAYYDQLIK